MTEKEEGKPRGSEEEVRKPKPVEKPAEEREVYDAEKIAEQHAAISKAENEKYQKDIREDVYATLKEGWKDQSKDTQAAIDKIIDVKDKHPNQSLFQLIESRLDEAYLDPVQNKDLIPRLIEARKLLYAKAKAADVLQEVQQKLADVEITDEFGKNEERIRRIDRNFYDEWVSKYEDDSSPDFRGVASAYLDNAINEAAEAYYAVKGLSDTDEAKQVKQHLRRYGLGSAPTGLRRRIKEAMLRREERERPSLGRGEMLPQTSQLLGRRIGAALASRKGGGSMVEALALHSSGIYGNKDLMGERKHIVPVFDITDKDQLKQWMEANMLAYTGTIGDSPAKSWMQHVNYYIDYDLMAAFQLYERAMLHDEAGNKLVDRALIDANREIDKVRRNVDGIKKEMIMKMSVHTAYAAMKASTGSFTTFATHMTMGSERGPNLDNVDDIKEHLLMDNKEYWWKVLGGTYDTKTKTYIEPKDTNSLTYQSYKKLLDAMGLTVKEWRYEKDPKGKAELRESEVVGIQIFEPSGSLKKEFEDLKRHLGKEGFEGWIKQKLDEEDANYVAEFEEWEEDGRSEEQKKTDKPKIISREERTLAYRNAVALMMVDGKYTKWTQKLGDLDKKTRLENGIEPGGFKPADGWGGDPLAGILNPAILPESIKHVYDDPGDKKIMELFRKAFRPSDVVSETSDSYYTDENGKQRRTSALMNASLVGGGTKDMTRFTDAIFKALGSSRAKGLGDFGRDGAAALEDIMELLDQVHGDKVYQLKGGGTISGKELSGAMMARLLHVKALAAISDSPPPTFMENTLLKLGPMPEVKFMQNGEALQFLLGPKLDGRSGYLAKLMGSRTRVEFRGEANRYIDEAVDLLRTGNQDAAWRMIGEFFNLMGLGVDIYMQTVRSVTDMAGIDVMPRRK